MTTPIPERGQLPDLFLSIQQPETGLTTSSGATHTIHLLAGTTFALPKHLHLKLFYNVPVFKIVPRNHVINSLIKKFDPLITQLAVMTYKGQPLPKVERPVSTNETGQKRDEAKTGSTSVPKGEAKGENVVNIQVFKGEKGQQNQQPPAKPGTPQPSGENRTDAPQNAGKLPLPEKSASARSESHATQKKSETAEGNSTEASPRPEQATPPRDVPKKTGESPESGKESSAPPKTSSQPHSSSPGAVPSKEAPTEMAAKKLRPDNKSSFSSDQGKSTSEAGKSSQEKHSEATPQPAKNDTQEENATFASRFSSPSQPRASLNKNENSGPLNRKTDSPELKKEASPSSQNKLPAGNVKTEASPKTDETIDRTVVQNSPRADQEQSQPSTIPQKLGLHKVEPVHPKDRSAIHVPPQVDRLHQEQASAPIAHRFFQTVDNDSRAFIPPWLALLLPDLAQNDSVRREKGGKQKSTGVQNPHKLSDILFMVLCAKLSGADSLGAVFQSIESREKWFQVILGLKYGLPPRQLIFWVLTTLDPKAFDHALRRWLEEVAGKTLRRAYLIDILLWLTPVGFMIGQPSRPNLTPIPEDPVAICEGFKFVESVLMIKAGHPHTNLVAKIRQKGGSYIIEMDSESLQIPEIHEKYESYVEGVERIVIQKWDTEGYHQSYFKVTSEIVDHKGPIHVESCYASNLSDPVPHYFDLARVQRAYENRLSWLVNVALTLPSVDEAIARATTSLSLLERFAVELLEKNAQNTESVESLMKKVAGDDSFLLQLLRDS